MILGYCNPDRVKSTCTPYTDIHHLPWAGDTQAQMVCFLRTQALMIEHMIDLARLGDQQRDGFFEQYEEHNVLKEHAWA